MPKKRPGPPSVDEVFAALDAAQLPNDFLGERDRRPPQERPGNEAGERIAATWEMSELAFSPLRDDDHLRFEDGSSTGEIVESRNGKIIRYSISDYADWPYHVHAILKHMARTRTSTWSGTGEEIKLIIGDGPPIC